MRLVALGVHVPLDPDTRVRDVPIVYEQPATVNVSVERSTKF
jgi:hypothetical protein